MKTDYLAFRNAEMHVKSYSKESEDVMQRHAEAMDCRNCEAFLQMGIDAFEWLMRADRAFRMAIYRGEKEYEADSEKSLRILCRNWLVPCDVAEKWIETQQTKGYEIDNLDEFRRCVSEITAIVDADEEGDNAPLPEQIAMFRDSAIEEFRNGQTAEFI
jgi:hypothetical protein